MKKTNLSEYKSTDIPSGTNYRIGIVVAEWNPEVTHAMLQGAVDTLTQHGVSQNNIQICSVPGTFELTCAANWMANDIKAKIDAVICIGCVIQGETRHFEFICQAVSQGLTNVSINTQKPIIFSVLTTDTMQQALDRAGGKLGNKGVEGAITALKMCAL